MKSVPDNISIDRLRGPLLRSVSRSFYLSIRLLPSQLRDPIALAYLLARATDTIADTTELRASSRGENLRTLAQAIQGKTSREAEDLRESFAPLQRNQAERALIEALPSCLDWLHHLAEDDRNDVRSVLEKINRGQLLDVRRFGDTTETLALGTAAELDEYTYLVAGCVGEFWTQLCVRHLRNFSDRPANEMCDLGREYGKGLQLINILRDAGADLRNGRCYFPEDELCAGGVEPDQILRKPTRAQPIFEKWRQRAEGDLGAGLEYACAISSPRVRFATALPALIGARTLALLRQTGINPLEQNVKASRAEIRRVIATAAMTLASPRSLRKMFERLTGLPRRS